MTHVTQPPERESFSERVAQVRNRLVERLQTFRPGPRIYATAFCVGATIGEYAALAGSTDPTAVLAAIGALSAQLGVNLLADIIGDREPPPGLTAEEIAEAVQERLEQGEDLPAVRALLQEFGTLQLALETWQQAQDKRWQQLVDELSRHPQLIAGQVTQDVVTALDPRLVTLEERTQRILELLEATPRTPGPPPPDALKVFISGTQEDLQPKRAAVEAAIAGLRLIPLRAETMGSQPHPSREAILKAVADCDIYLGVYGRRYGWRVPDLDVSATELEYDEAQRLGKPTLIYVKDVADPEPAQANFLRRVQDFDAGYFRRPRFAQPEELAEWVQRDLAALMSELVRDPDAVRHRQLALAYAGEVRQKFEYWRRRYVALPAQATLPAPDTDKRSTTSLPERTPSYFRPRGVRLTYREPAPGERPEKREPKHFDDVRDAVAEAGDAVLLGEPGAGKTTSLWRLMLDYADRAVDDPAAPLPILVPLGGYDGQSDVLAFVRRQLAEAVVEDEDGQSFPLLAHRRLAGRLENELARRRLALFFDGLNEIPRDSFTAAVARLRAFRAGHPGNRFLFTCREADYSAHLSLSEIRIEPLDDDAIRDFIRAYLPDQAETLADHLECENRPVWEMVQNPYLLRMVVTIYEERGDLPANRAELFGEFVGALLRRECFIHPDRYQITRRRPARSAQSDLLAALAARWPLLREWDAHPKLYGLESLSDSDRRSFLIQAGLTVVALAHLAYTMSAAGQRGTTVPQYRVIRNLPKRVRLNGHQVTLEPSRLLYLARSAKLLEGIACVFDYLRSGFRFTHQLLQEYFAAVHLNALGSDHPEVLECLRYNAWDETVVLLAGLTPDLDRLVEHLIPLDPFLAARCAGACPNTLSSEIARCLVEDLTRLAYDIYSPWQEEAIGALGATCLSSTLPVLLHLTQNQPVYIRQTAAEALGQLGAQEAIPTLLELLRDVEECVRQAAAEALGKLWTRDDVPKLAELLRDDDWHVRRAAATALGSLGMQGAAPALLDRLRDDDWHVREAAAEALAKLGVQEAIPALVDRLWDKQWIVCQVAARALRKLGAREQVPALVRLLRSDDWHVRRAAMEVLGAVGAQEVTPILVEWLEDKSTIARQAAVWALGELGVREAIPNLMVLLHDPRGDIRESAAQALGELGAHESSPQLISLLSDANGNVRQSAINALVKLKAHQSIPKIVPLLHDPLATVRWYAAEALRELGAQSALPELRALLHDQNESVRWHVVGVIEGLEVREAVPDLVILLHDVDGPTAERAADALAKLEAREVVPLAVTMLHDSKADKRGLAARILGELGARQAIPHLVVLLGDEEGIVRERAANALVKLEVREVIPNLLGLLRDPREVVRAQAIHVLEELGAQEAIPYLMALLRDSRKAECKRVAWALGELKAEVCMMPQLLLCITGDTYAARQSLRTLSVEAVLPVLRPLLSYPDGLVRKRLLRLYGEVRRKAGLLREGEVTHGPYPARAALRAVVTLADDVLALLPGWSLAARSRAHILRRLGCPAALQALEVADAEVDLAHVVEVEPWHPETFGRRGQLALARGQFEEALEAFDEAGRRDPHNVRWQYCMAFAHMGLDMSEQAMSALETALNRTDLHEQVEAALQNLDLLTRAQPDLPELEAVRDRILERKALLDKLAEEECARYGLR